MPTNAPIPTANLRGPILEDIERFPDSGQADIYRRIGPEIQGKRYLARWRQRLKGGPHHQGATDAGELIGFARLKDKIPDES